MGSCYSSKNGCKNFRINKKADVSLATESAFLEEDSEEELFERFLQLGESNCIRKVYVNGQAVVAKS